MFRFFYLLMFVVAVLVFSGCADGGGDKGEADSKDGENVVTENDETSDADLEEVETNSRDADSEQQADTDVAPMAANRLKVVEMFDIDGYVTLKKTYKYDENGVLEEIAFEGVTGHDRMEEDAYTTYEYNDQGFLHKETNRDETRKAKAWVVYEYNAQQQLSKAYHYMSEVPDNHVKLVEYSYDDEGRKIEEVTINSKNELFITYEYKDSKLHRKTAERSTDGEKTVLNYAIYEYDDEGLKIKKTGHSRDDKIYLVENYEYNDDGKMEKSEQIAYSSHPDTIGNKNSFSYEYQSVGDSMELHKITKKNYSAPSWEKGEMEYEEVYSWE